MKNTESLLLILQEPAKAVAEISWTPALEPRRRFPPFQYPSSGRSRIYSRYASDGAGKQSTV